MAANAKSIEYGTKNLRPFDQRPEDEQNAIRVAGGKASGAARRRAKTIREGLKMILALDLPAKDRDRALLEQLGLDPSYGNAINLSVIRKAQATGDVDAARYVRDTIGEKPREALEIGNLDDKPLASVDLSRLSDEQLRALVAQREAVLVPHEDDGKTPE